MGSLGKEELQRITNSNNMKPLLLLQQQQLQQQLQFESDWKEFCENQKELEKAYAEYCIAQRQFIDVSF